MTPDTTTYLFNKHCYLNAQIQPTQRAQSLHMQHAMNLFLADIERRAFRMAEIATNNREDALDLVQEAMMSLVKNYAHKPKEEWGALFHRILQSKIRDHYRRSSVRNRLRGWLSFGHKDTEEADIDPIQLAADPQGKNPQDMLINENSGEALQHALKALPLRQQQAFLLRNWQAMNVAQTAHAMGCSEGSVKTHYSRAIQQLRHRLAEHQS